MLFILCHRNSKGTITVLDRAKFQPQTAISMHDHHKCTHEKEATHFFNAGITFLLSRKYCLYSPSFISAIPMNELIKTYFIFFPFQ